MAGRKTPKDSTPPSEASTAAEGSARPDMASATPPETDAQPQGPGDRPEAMADAPKEEAASGPADPMVIEETSAALRPPEAEPEVEPAARPEPDPAPENRADPAAASAPVVVRRGPGVVPLLASGAVIAVLAFGLAQYANHGWPFGTGQDQTAALTSELAAQSKKIAALEAEISRQGQSSAALPGRIDKLGTDLGAKIAAEQKAANARIETNSLAISDLKDSVSKIASTGGGSAGAVPADVADKLAALDKRVKALEDNVNGQIAAARKMAEAEKAKSEAAAKQAGARAALTRINAALTAGGSYTGPVQTLRQAGIEVPQALSGAAETGVPTLATLQAEFDPAARKALGVSVRDTMGGGTWARVKAFLQVQTGARSLTPRSGDGPDAVLSRAQAAVDKGDLSAAIETIKALPKAGQDAMAPWVAKAEIRLKAEAAAKALGAKLDGK